MPINRVVTNGKTGYRYGTTGHIYYGPGGAAKAALQERAILATGWKPASVLIKGK